LTKTKYYRKITFVIKLLLKKRMENIPASPGVYIFLDKNKKPLYVGKAVNLKNRVKSYFTRSSGDSRVLISKMLGKISKIDFKETESEIEALILESQLIKKLKPRFNIVMRDDKQYFYVGITREDFPKIFLTHQMENHGKTKTTRYNFIGPFTDGKALKTTLKLLRRAFPYCTCKQKHHNPCLNYHIDNCLGFCCLKSINKKQITDSKKIYQKNIRAIRDILQLLL